MILSIGEILADLIGEKNDGALTFRAFCGGAPFNLAVNAKQSGATVGFVGRVGNDVIGRFVTAEAEKANLDGIDIQTDEKRNTTIAFVTLMNGERDFAFNRHDTADFNIDFDKIDFAKYENLNIVHLGSLMLSEEKGRAFAKRVADKTKEIGAKLSFDVNFRKDIFRDFDAAKRAYEPFVKRADIVKFSEDELLDFTGISGIDAAAESLCDKDKLILVTLGKNGSAYYFNGEKGVVPSEYKCKSVERRVRATRFSGRFLRQSKTKNRQKKTLFRQCERATKRARKRQNFLGR